MREMLRPSCRLSKIKPNRVFWQCVSRRSLTRAAAANPGPKPGPPVSTHQKKDHDDRVLREIFDSKSFRNDISGKRTARVQRGLLQNKYLTELKGFLNYAQFTRTKCQKIVDYVLSASSPEEYINIPRKLDLLSDSLCRVLDVADFVRATHPDARFQDAATQAYSYLFEYMNILNSTPGLDAQLRKAVENPEVSRAWNEEERIVAHILLKDFAQSAIYLPSDQRRRFVDLSSQMKRLGSEFVENMSPKKAQIEIEASRLKGMNPLLLGKLRTGRGRTILPAVGDVPYAALGSVEDSDIRREIYTAGRQCSDHQIEILEKLMRTRAEIASLSGYKSHAHMSLSDKLAGSPEAVHSFLNALSIDNAPTVKRELSGMQELKSKGGERSEIQPWDLQYYRNRLISSRLSTTRKSDFISAYFSLGTVMQGLSRLFDRLYGIRFVPCETTAGEIWNNDVRRLNVVHETEGHVAVLYCDLFARAGKTPNPTHFTLRCSRLISQSEIAEANDSAQEANDGMAVSSPTNGNLSYQLPVIALICDFPHPSNSSSPALLTFQDVKTLFHEMGHAIHSILGRTSLQIVSGTRCPTDFAELPSVLMEYFASDASVLALFARHWETDAPLPYQMVKDELQLHEQGHGLHMETQILFSLLDQAYHSSLPLTMAGGFDSTQVFFDVYDQYGSVREPRDTNAQGLFGHLVEYGGTYYSYLFDRAIAGKLWKEVFREGRDGGGIDREAGERYKGEVLKWGGGRSGWACISGALGDERLKDGGKEAMEEVGRWGVHDSS